MRKKTFLASIIILGLIYFFLRIKGLGLQPVFCDEAIYIHWAQQILKNFHLNAFISLTDGKTPLFMWAMVPFLRIFPDPLVAGRLPSIFSGLATVIGAVVLGKKFFNLKVGLIAGFLIAVVPFTVFFDKLALADSMLAAFSLWSLIFALDIAQKPSIKSVILLGLTLGAGIWVKTPGLFSFLTLPVVFLAINFKKEKLIGVAERVSGLVISGGLGFGIYNLLRVSPYFINLSSRDQDYYFPIRRLLETPLNPFLGHLRDLADWLPKMLTWPIIILIAISIGLIIYKKNVRSLVILLWGLIPLTVMMLLLKTFTARYILFCIIPMIFLAGWAADFLYNVLPLKNKRAPLLAVIIVFLIPAFSFDHYLMTDPQKAPLPREERHGYFEDWTAGYGLKEIAAYLKSQTANGKIVVVTEGSFGTLPDGLDIYTKDDPNIEVWYSTPVLTSDVYVMAQLEPTFFIVNKSRMTFNKSLKLIHEYPRALGPGLPQDALMFYQVSP